MAWGSVPPVGPRGNVGGAQGPGEIPERAKEDAKEILDAYKDFSQLYAKYSRERDPAKKQALLNQMKALLERVESKCLDISNMKPPLPAEIVEKAAAIANEVHEFRTNWDQATIAKIVEVGMQIGILSQLING